MSTEEMPENQSRRAAGDVRRLLDRPGLQRAVALARQLAERWEFEHDPTDQGRFSERGRRRPPPPLAGS